MAVHFYLELINKMLALPRGSVLLTGGRGIGKTTVLREIMRRRQAASREGSHVMFIVGRDGQGAIQEMARAAGDEAFETVIIDDIDRVITGLEDVQQTKAFHRSLAALFSSTTRRVFLASYHSIHWLDRRLQPGNEVERMISYLLHTPQWEAMTPWMSPWARVQQRVFGSIEEDEDLEQQWEEADGDTETLRRTWRIFKVEWIKATETLTGGHPALLFASRDLLLSLIRSNPGADLAEVVIDIDSALKNHLSLSALTTIQRAMRELSASADPLDQAAFGHALNMARAGGQHIPPPSHPHLDPEEIFIRLQEEAFVYLDMADSKYKIPGSLIASRLLRLGGAPNKATYRLVPEGDGNKGKLYWTSAGGEFDLVLRRTQWAILLYLARAAPRAVPIDELVNKLALKTEPSFRSAYQRLDTALRNRGLKITENIRSKGYRFTVKASLPPKS